MSDNEQEVTVHIEQQQDNVSLEVFGKLNKTQKNSIKTDATFCFDSADKSIPIHNISWATTDESEQQKAGRRRPRGYSKIKKRAKTYVERPEDEPTCSKYVDRFVISSDQHENDDEDTTITRAYVACDEDDSVSIRDQDQVCHDVAELLQLEQARNNKVDQHQDAFLDDICQNFKEKQEAGIPLTNNKFTKIINQLFKGPLTDEKIKKLLKEYSRPANCKFAKAQLCNPKIWRLNLATLQRSIDIMLQKVCHMLLKLHMP